MLKKLFAKIGGASSLITIWEGVIKPIYKNYLSDMRYENYFQENWLMLVGLLGLITTMWLLIWDRRKDSKITNERLSEIEDYIQKKDLQEMDVEILHAVCWWIVSLNKTQEDIYKYIHHYFPRNEQKIINYLNNKPG